MTELARKMELQDWRAWWLLPGTALALILCFLLWLLWPADFYAGWLAAVLLPWSISIGSLALILIFQLTGGAWARATWPWLAVPVRLIPLVAAMFVPVLFGLSHLYPWMNGNFLGQFEATQNRQWYYQPAFFVGRTIVYWVIWTVISVLAAGPLWLRRVAERPVAGGQGVAGVSLVVLLLTVTWAAIDWIMSLDPFFVSTLFGMLIGIGAMLSALCAALATACFQPTLQAVREDDKTMGDLGNLLLAFLMLWAYLSFSQFLIMWSGNLPVEAAYYVARNRAGWKWVTAAGSLLGFVLPFLCLLSRDFKRSPGKVGALAIALICFRQVELWWFIVPGVRSVQGLHVAIAAVPTALAVWGLSALATRWIITRSG